MQVPDTLSCISHVSYRYYFAHVVGSKGSVRLRLEKETKTEIHVPRQWEDGCIGTSNISHQLFQIGNRIC